MLYEHPRTSFFLLDPSLFTIVFLSCTTCYAHCTFPVSLIECWISPGVRDCVSLPPPLSPRPSPPVPPLTQPTTLLSGNATLERMRRLQLQSRKDVIGCEQRGQLSAAVVQLQAWLVQGRLLLMAQGQGQGQMGATRGGAPAAATTAGAAPAGNASGEGSGAMDGGSMAVSVAGGLVADQCVSPPAQLHCKRLRPCTADAKLLARLLQVRPPVLHSCAHCSCKVHCHPRCSQPGTIEF